ncbi:MAG: helix-turn-helix transcriptional regulator [Candidatus Dojkabacteria bacterium]
MFNPTIGQKVKIFRYRSGMSQFDLELEINASSGVICRLESDRVNPTKETLFAISKALKLTEVETAYLFGIIEKENINIIELQFGRTLLI